MRVMGISGALNHDAAVSLIEDRRILYASHSVNAIARKRMMHFLMTVL